MSDEHTRSKRFKQRRRNIYAKALEHEINKQRVIKDPKEYKRKKISPRDIIEIEEYDDEQAN